MKRSGFLVAAMGLLKLICFEFGVKSALGVSSSACDTLIPEGAETHPDNTKPPYQIRMSSQTYTAGFNIAVTLTGEKYFRGFVLHAVAVQYDLRVGTWTDLPQNASHVTCHDKNDTVSQRVGSVRRTSVTLTWSSPHRVGPIRFIATVLERKRSVWPNITSRLLWPDDCCNCALSTTDLDCSIQSPDPLATRESFETTRETTREATRETVYWNQSDFSQLSRHSDSILKNKTKNYLNKTDTTENTFYLLTVAGSYVGMFFIFSLLVI